MEGEMVRAGFERKYLVPERQAEALLSAVTRLLPPDPYGACYPVASLYLDTPDLASYHREMQGKWRLRRYASGATVFAEFKAKPQPGQVHKRRSPLTVTDCEQLPYSSGAGWFLRAVHKNSLQPTRLVSYERHAFVGLVQGEMIRLTLDRDVRAAVRSRFAVPEAATDGIPLTDGRILEIKFERELPESLKQVVGELGLLPESFSKYRAAVEKAA